MSSNAPSQDAAQTPVAVIGGTGHLGAAIARRLARAGVPVIIGSRDAAKAAAAANALHADVGRSIGSAVNADAAQAAGIIILTVPFASQEATLRDIAPGVAGKIVVDTTVPLMPPKVMRVQLPPEGSAAVRAQRILEEAMQPHPLASHAGMRLPVVSWPRRRAPSLVLVLALLLSGCAGFSPDAGMATVAELSRERTGHAPRLVRDDATRALVRARVDELLAAPLSADAAVELAMLASPALPVHW